MTRLVDPDPPRWSYAQIVIDVQAPVDQAMHQLLDALTKGRYRFRKNTPSSVRLVMKGGGWWFLDEITPFLGWIERRTRLKVGHLGQVDEQIEVIPSALDEARTRITVISRTIDWDAKHVMADELEEAVQKLQTEGVLIGVSPWQPVDADAEKQRRAHDKEAKKRRT